MRRFAIRLIHRIRRKILHLINYNRFIIKNSKRSSPNLIIIGAMRSGTTSLYQYLNGHPNLLAPTEKEPSYFSWRANIGIKNYLNYFPLKNNLNEQLVFDCSATTFHCPSAADRISRTLPNIKIICILRDPIERAISHYNYCSSPSSIYGKINPHLVEKRTILQSFEDDMKGNVKDLYQQYFRFGLYGEQLEAYYQNFDINDILILDFDILKNSPKILLKRISDFLKIDSSYFELYTETKNKIPSVESFVPMSKRELNIFNSIANNISLSLYMENMLIDFYKKDVNRLLRLTNMDFSWSKKYTG